MEEKIKIYVTDSINAILLKDMERFEFYKKDNSFNKNEFYNTLILNYYQQYQEEQSNLFSHIKETISSHASLKDAIINNIASDIISYTNSKSNSIDQQKSSIVLAMKPTKFTSDVFDFIENYCLINMSLSAYFRNMFASYCMLPQDKRERIIFKKNFELIEKAIKENKKIYFTTTNSDKIHIASPYSISNSKEELFNYVLVDYKYRPFSFRIGRIKKLAILNESRSFNNNNIEIFKKMEQQGPQYSYEPNEVNNIIKVFLTDAGKEKYKKIYLLNLSNKSRQV